MGNKIIFLNISYIANRNLGIIYRTFTYLNPEMFLSLYKSIVRPHLEYASVIWSPLYKKDKRTLENIQRRATRLIQAMKGKNYSERLKRLGLPTLEYRRERADIVEVYKIMNDIDLANKEKLFQMATFQATRGHPLKLFFLSFFLQETFMAKCTGQQFQHASN